MKQCYMNKDSVFKNLISEIEQFETIDSHEHLYSEKERVSIDVDVFTLFSHYTRYDLRTAGMSAADCNMLQDTTVPIEYRWKKFQPYWETIRWTSFSRAALLAAEKFYGAEDINEKNYLDISRAMKEANKPGLYHRVLKEACKLKVSLLECKFPDVDPEFFVPVVDLPLHYVTRTWNSFCRPVFSPDTTVNTLDDYIGAACKYVDEAKAKGAVAIKFIIGPNSEPDRKKALEVFEQLKNGSVKVLPEINPLKDYINDQIISFAGEKSMVVAVHTGYWGDFRKLDPLHVIPILQRHPKVRFDIFHLGFPWVRETLMLAKGFSNVWLNLCWTHIISQKFATSALIEALDLVPVNKILAFGGDYKTVEKVYGHLVMAREDVASALACRIREGLLTETQAVDIARKWFCENLTELYSL